MLPTDETLTEESLKAYAQRGLYVIPEKMSVAYLRRFGFSPQVVFDVGVSNGTPFLYELFKGAKLVLIDPLPGFEEKIMSRFAAGYDFAFRNCGAAAASGVARLKIQSDTASKSTFGEPTRIQGQNVKEIVEVPVRTLDEIAAEFPGRVGLKIDTEGHELEVLRGARETLKRTEFVLAEVSIKARFVGGYRFSDVIAFMSDNGFEVIDLLNPIWRVHMFWDCLFVRKESPLFSSRAV